MFKPSESGTKSSLYSLLHFIYADAAKKFKAIQAWWRNMTEQNYKSSVRSATSISNCSTAQKTSFDILRGYFVLLL